MNNIYIFTHQGMGDAIMANGIIRTYTEKYDRVYVFCKPKYTKNVIWMYRDNDKVFAMPMEDAQVTQFMQICPFNNYLIVGHNKLHEELRSDPKGRFDKISYRMANVPFEDKWNKFYLQRNFESEKETYYSVLGLKDNEEFVFVHDDEERPMLKSKLPKNVKMVRPDRKDVSIFDFLYTIEKAKEVHCIDSCFLNLIDCVQLRNDNLFFHKYVKIHLVGEGGTPTTKLNWVVL
jgi:hypothetical protein